MDDLLIRFYEIPNVVFAVIGLLERIFCILMIYFSSKYRSGFPKGGWYIFAFLFPLATGIVFFVRRKEMGAPDMKACPICKSKYPKDFTYCHKCNVELGEYDPQKKKTQKVLAAVFSVMFFVCGAASFVTNGVNLLAWDYFPAQDDGQAESGEPGVAVDGVYYDRDGNSYLSFLEVPLYTKDGKKFVYSNATERYESRDSSLSEYDCVVGEDGYLCETPASELKYVSDGLSGDTYYEDAKRNRYHSIFFIGWNEKGELLLCSEYDKLDYEVIGRSDGEE